MTVTASATTIWDAESVTNWTTNKGDVYSGWQRQGSYCLGDQVSQASFNEIYDYYTANGSYLNISGKFVTVWVLLWGSPNSLANGGIGYYLEDSIGNAVYLHLGGSDKGGMYYGAYGWQCFSFYANSSYLQSNVTYTQVSGSLFPDLTSLAKVGVHFDITSKAVGTSPNVMWDVSYALDYVTVTGGTQSTPLTFDDIASADDTNAWGVISKLESGVYELQGKFRIGDTSSTTYFVDKGNLLIFKDTWVPDLFHEITVYRGASNTTVFQLGEKSGSAGINGCLIRAPSGKRVKIDAYTNYDTTNISLGDIGLYGSNFYYVGEGKLPDSSNAEVLTSNFLTSGLISAYQAKVESTKFIGSSTAALTFGTTVNVSDCDFVGNTIGVTLATAGTYTFDALRFSGNQYDIENTSGGTVVIQCTNRSNPSTSISPNGGTVEIQNVVYLNVYVNDSTGNPLSDVRVAVYKESDMTQLMNELTNTSGLAQETFQYPGSDVSVIIRARKSSPNGTRYIPVETYGVITSSGMTQYITMYVDPTFGG